MLQKLKSYFISAKQANMAELSQWLEVPPEVVRGMLSHWQRKGKLERVKSCHSGCAQRCAGCNPLLLEQYQWLD